jgi:peptidoglycan L-alanyl-D-glutamate endopeptidase CwlK
MNIRSHQRLDHAHPQLRKLFIEAAKKCPVDIEIGEVSRTTATQAKYVKAGASTTMNSRHIPKKPHHKWYGEKPVSHAVDIFVMIDGKARWDWPLYTKAGAHIKDVAKKMGIAIVWGGDWRSFKDGPHFELDRKTYP